MDKNKKNKLIMLTISTLAILIIVVGVSYAFFRFSLSSANQELVAGQIYMHYKEGQKQINISEAVPSSTYDENEYFEFTIDGKNTSNKDIWYAITLSYGDAPYDRDTKIDDKFLKFTLFEDTSKVVDGASYKNLNNKKLWVNKIDKNTTGDVNIIYKLYMWISDKVNIGDDGDYTINDWNNKVYTSVKVNVVGDFTEKTIDKPDGDGPSASGLAATILEKAYTDTSELIAIDNDGNKCNDLESCDGNIREYRYIGPTVNNYIYLKDNNGYNETWRIIGLFLNDEGTEWNIKVIRNEVLHEEYLPKTYTFNEIQYNLKMTSSTSTYFTYWNRGGNNNNDWSVAGLQYFLNTEQDSDGNYGYLHYLSSETKSLLLEKTYYLGAIHEDSYAYSNPKDAYSLERDVESCVNGKGPSKNNNQKEVASSIGCRVWADNASTWKGKVALMYPSDYGFSANEIYWTTPLYAKSGDNYSTDKVRNTSWMFSTMNDGAFQVYSWMISPSDKELNEACSLFSGGGAGGGFKVNDGSATGSYSFGIRPVLNLNLNAELLEGNGTHENPYRIFKENEIEGLAKEIVDKAYTNANELIAIDKEGNKCNDLESCVGNIREYRYIGPEVNNYIYLKSDTNVNELWRIIGVFSDYDEKEWYLRVVRNAVLPSSYLPTEFEINGRNYTIQYTPYNSSDNWVTRWNSSSANGTSDRNNWKLAGLRYFLNNENDTKSVKGFLSYLSTDTKALLVERTDTLGTVHTDSDSYVNEMVKNAYKHERDIDNCIIGPNSNNSKEKIEASTGCKVWSNNVSKWKGKVSLMYPSDYGYSVNEENWTKLLGSANEENYYEDNIKNTSWMYKTMSKTFPSDAIWLLSPTSSGSQYVSVLRGGAIYSYSILSSYGVRPVLNISIKTLRLDGDGTSSKPYKVIAD